MRLCRRHYRRPGEGEDDVNWFSGFVARLRAKRALNVALNRYGWDGKCSDCGEWLHASGKGEFVTETDVHWHYRCTCGAMTHFALWAPVPISDQVAGQAAFDARTP